MSSRSMKAKQLSRSKIDLLNECPRCFFDDVALGHVRPPSFPFTLNNAVDSLLKAEFDVYRREGKPHPLFATVGLDVVPFAHPELDQWRKNFTGVRWADPVTGWTFYGAVDDVWVTPEKTLIVADYKATARRDDLTQANIYPSYQRQVEVYQYLLEQQGFEVENRAWFVYANGIPGAARFGDQLSFRTKLLPYDGERGWVVDAFRQAVALATGGVRPLAAAECKWCAYVAGRSIELGRTDSVRRQE